MNYEKVYIVNKPPPSMSTLPKSAINPISRANKRPAPKPTTQPNSRANKRPAPKPPIYVEDTQNEFIIPSPKKGPKLNKYYRLIDKPKPSRPPKTYKNGPKLNKYYKLVNEEPKPKRPPPTYKSSKTYERLQAQFHNPTYKPSSMKKLPNGWVKFT